jgi:hypothetical protein
MRSADDLPNQMASLIASLRPLAIDEADAADLAADLFSFQAFTTRSKLASNAGRPIPAMPKFSSEIMRSCARRIRMILVSLAQSVTETEMGRLAAILRAIDHRDLDLNAIDVGGIFSRLISMHPDDAASWLRAHLHMIEGRLAS